MDHFYGGRLVHAMCCYDHSGFSIIKCSIEAANGVAAVGVGLLPENLPTAAETFLIPLNIFGVPVRRR